MSEKAPLEDLVNTLPPVKKKRRKKETKIQPLASTVEQDQTLANLLDDLIRTYPQSSATNDQPTLPTVEEKSYNLNVCPFHKSNLILFEARTNGESYIKCQVHPCLIFMHQDSSYDYMSSVCGKLQESYLTRKRNLICGCQEAVSLRVSKTEKNPNRPYFVCRDKDCRFFQWADEELSQKNKKKQGKRCY